MKNFLDDNLQVIIIGFLFLGLMVIFPEEFKIIVSAFNSSPLAPLQFSK